MPSDFLTSFSTALQALLKLAAVLGARDQRTHVQAEHGAVLQVLRHITLDDTLGQALSNGGFTDTGFTDQYRVVLASYGSGCG